MNTPPGDGAALARVLAGALSLGLPGPDSITISPHVTAVSAIDFQFNANYGQDPLPALTAWAARFGVTVDVSADSKDPASTWHEFNFTHGGVMFHAYAKVRAAEDAPARDGYVTLEEAARHVAARLGATGDGDDDGPLFDGPVTTKAELDEAYARAVSEDGEACDSTWKTGPTTYHCTRDPGHDPRHESAVGGHLLATWDDEGGTEFPQCPNDDPLVIAPGESAGPASLASVDAHFAAPRELGEPLRQVLITLDCGCSFTGPQTSVKKIYCDHHGRHEGIALIDGQPLSSPGDPEHRPLLPVAGDEPTAVPERTLHEERLQLIREGHPAVQDGPYAYIQQDGYMAGEGLRGARIGGGA